MDKLYSCKEDVPISRIGHAFAAVAFVTERMFKRLSESAFTSRSAIQELITRHLEDKLGKPELDELVGALLEHRKPLLEVRHDAVFRLAGARHELNMMQVAKEGSWRVMAKVEGGVAVPKDIRKRVKYVEPEVRPEIRRRRRSLLAVRRRWWRSLPWEKRRTGRNGGP